MFRADGPSGPVAIKVLAPAAELDPAARARFAREARALAELRHPGLVGLLDHGIDDELGPYLVLPLLDGANLRAAIGGARLGPEAAVLVAAPIADAVAAMHAAGFVHRDVKPENVIAGPDGHVTLIDLGLAWREGMTRHTESGAAVGTIGYMAPEQIEGREVGAPADVWAIGVMLHEWIAGTRPFARARPGEEAAAALVGGAARLTAVDRRVDDELATLVSRCLAPHPGDRPSARELADQLAARARAHTPGDDAERATLVAAPAAYAARIASVQARRLATEAEAALADGQPFVALAACDRGLAHVPDDAELLALVARIEAEAGALRTADVTGHAAAVSTAPAAESPAARRRTRWLVAGGALAVTTVAIVAAVVGGSAPGPSLAALDAAPSPDAAPPDEGLALARDVVDLFGRALEESAQDPRRSDRPTPTTATGWLARARSEPPAAALVSARRALALAPTWGVARREECRALVALEDAAAGEACATAVRSLPDDPAAVALHAITLGRAGDHDRALERLTWAIARDADPRWRAARADIHALRGDADAAAADRRDACALGFAAACP